MIRPVRRIAVPGPVPNLAAHGPRCPPSSDEPGQKTSPAIFRTLPYCPLTVHDSGSRERQKRAKKTIEKLGQISREPHECWRILLTGGFGGDSGNRPALF